MLNPVLREHQEYKDEARHIGKMMTKWPHCFSDENNQETLRKLGFPYRGNNRLQFKIILQISKVVKILLLYYIPSKSSHSKTIINFS